MIESEEQLAQVLKKIDQLRAVLAASPPPGVPEDILQRDREANEKLLRRLEAEVNTYCHQR